MHRPAGRLALRARDQRDGSPHGSSDQRPRRGAEEGGRLYDRRGMEQELRLVVERLGAPGGERGEEQERDPGRGQSSAGRAAS